MQATPAFTYNGVQFSAPNSLGSARQVPQSDGAGGTAWGWIAAGDVTGLGSLATLSAAPAGTLTGTTLASNVVTSSLTSVGTIATGVWNGTAILPAYISTSTSGANIPLMNGTNTWTGPQTIQQNGLAVTADPGLTLINSTASTSGSGRQGAPGVIFSGTQWNGAASIVDAWKLVTLPSSGSTVSSFLFQRSTNGGAYSNMMTLTSAGALSITTVNATGAIQSGGNFESTVNQSASTSPYLHSGTVRTAGSGTDTFPIFFHQPTGTTAATTYSTGGTIFGANAASGFSGNFLDFHVAGGSSVYKVDYTGQITTTAGVLASGNVVAGTTGLIGFSGRGTITSDSSSKINCSGGLTTQGNVTVNGNVTVTAAGQFSWGSGRAILTSPTTAWTQLGAADAASPIAQTLSMQSVVAGTSNTSAVDTTLIASLPTGTGAPGNVIRKAGFSAVIQTAATVTLSITSPCDVTFASHGFVPGQAVSFATSGALPTGLTAGTTYYVSPRGFLSGGFRLTTTPDGASDINTSGTQSGTHTCTTSATAKSQAMSVITYGPAGLTGAQATGLIDAVQYWNTSGTPTAHRFSVIAADGATNSNCRIFDVRYNSVSNLYFTKSRFFIGNGTAYTIDANSAQAVFTAAANNNSVVHSFVSGNQTQSNGSDHYDFRHTATFAPTAGASKYYGASFEHTVNQTSSATGDYTGLRVNLTKTAFLGTNSRLLELQLGGTPKLEVIDDGTVITAGKMIVTNPQTPSSASDTGRVGTIAWDSNFLYVCTATDTWKRAAISTW